jgi:hypothetical protein
MAYSIMLEVYPQNRGNSLMPINLLQKVGSSFSPAIGNHDEGAIEARERHQGHE